MRKSLKNVQPRAVAWPVAFTSGLVLAVAVSGIAAAGGAAQEAGSITGQVTDAATQAPVDGAQVSVEGTNRGALTNREGRYLITDVPPGPYTIRIVHIGMRSASQEATVSAGESAVADFALEVSAVSLDEVVVTGTAGAVERRKLGNSLASIDVAEIAESVRSSRSVRRSRGASPASARSARRAAWVRVAASASAARRASSWTSGRSFTSTACAWTRRPRNGA